MPSGRKSARRGRVDYKKLSTGDADWKASEDHLGPKTPVKVKALKDVDKRKDATSPLETYLLMLYVTLEQETAIKQLFKERKWHLLKADLSALTDETGPTTLNHKKESDSKSTTDSKTKNTEQTNDDVEIKPEEPKYHETDNDDIIGDSDMEMIDDINDIDDVDDDYSPPVEPPSKKRKHGKSPKAASIGKKAVMSKSIIKEAQIIADCQEPKLDGTEDIQTTVDEVELSETDQQGIKPNNKDTYTKTPENAAKPRRGRRGQTVKQIETANDDIGMEDNATDEMEAKNDKGNVTDTTDEKIEDSNSKKLVDAAPDEDIEEIKLEKRCWECETTLEDENDHAEHMMKQHSFDVKTGRYYCEPCDKHFKQPEYLKDHNKHVHEGAKRRPQKTTRDHICDICGRSFKRPDQLKEHRSMVHFKTPLNTHECDICGKKFARPKLLGYHMNKHVGNKPYQCSTCGNSYFSQGGLYVHSRMCKRLNPVSSKCEICQKNFSSQYALKVHMVGVHSKTQPAYRCSCGKFLKWKTSIRKHQINCPQNAENVTEITREEYDDAMKVLTKARIIKEESSEAMEATEIVLQTEDGNIESQVTEVTDERLVEEITGKIANELSKSGSVNTDDEKMITETIRNAVLSGNETQVITIPRPAGAENEENVYYVIVNPNPEEQV